METKTIINCENAIYVDYKSVISKIEITELSNDEKAYMPGYKRLYVADSLYVFSDKKGIVYLFDNNGELLSNSRDKKGKGNGEYEICLAVTYNHYSGNVEIVTPVGIMMYDKNFNYVGMSAYKDKETQSLMFNYIYDISAHEHLLISPLPHDGNTSYLYIYDSKERRITKKLPYDEGCPYITMQEQCVSDDNFIAFPNMSYSFYHFDRENYELKQSVVLDFGKNSLAEKDISSLKDNNQRGRYLAAECNKALALRTFKCGEKIVSIVKEGPERSDFRTYIVNLERLKTQYLKYEYEDMKVPLFEAFKNNVLYACVPENEVFYYIDKSLLDKKSLDILAKHTENSNFYIIKYYLTN